MSSTITDTNKPSRVRGSRAWRVGLTAAIVVLALGAASIFLSTGGDPFPGEASPVEIAEAYLDARNDYDIERARELISDDFTTTEAPSGHVDASTIGLAFQGYEDYGVAFTEVSCKQAGETPEWVSVYCDFLWSTEIHRIGGFEPTQTRYVILIRDGLILQVLESASYSPWWDSFVAFLESEAPEEFADAVYRSVDSLDPEAVQTVTESLPRYFDLYAQWLASQGD